MFAIARILDFICSCCLETPVTATLRTTQKSVFKISRALPPLRFVEAGAAVAAISLTDLAALGMEGAGIPQLHHGRCTYLQYADASNTFLAYGYASPYCAFSSESLRGITRITLWSPRSTVENFSIVGCVLKQKLCTTPFT
mmetsp:Transcript_57025/g.94576  ORF Transcript_57025/g.94576 Transcript_57025/m.94576 type:complete len:141 (-) Transcript_57025:79-501(-)